MPLKLATLYAQTTTVDMPYLGETLSITWSPAGWTPALQDEVSSAEGENENTKAVVKALAALIRSWDLQDGAGKAVPTTVARLMELPKAFLMDVLGYLNESVAPKEESEPPSSDT